MKKIFMMGILISMFSCNRLTKNTNYGSALGTSYSITYLANKELDYQSQIDSVFTAVNQSMSTYLPNSDISKINQGDSTIVVDAMFKDVFELSYEVYRRTDGYFDPTVGILVNAWGFGPGNQIKLDSTRVDSLLNYVGFDKVGITESNTIWKASPSVYFDFNAIAKGYAIDRLAAMLDVNGITDYLVEVGGEIVTKGENRIAEKKWTVGVDDPQGKDRSKPKILLELKNRALASSGNYRKFRIDSITGKKYVHTINPKTGYTKNSNVLGATVIANTCAEADAFATAFMAMDLDDSIKLLVKQDALEAYIIYLDKNGEPAEFMTMGFEELIVK